MSILDFTAGAASHAMSEFPGAARLVFSLILLDTQVKQHNVK